MELIPEEGILVAAGEYATVQGGDQKVGIEEPKPSCDQIIASALTGCYTTSRY